MAEKFTVDILLPGYYCLAVWKAKGNDLALDGTYRLISDLGATDVAEGGELPAQTALASIYPTSFNLQTTIAFDFAHLWLSSTKKAPAR